jgi:methyltransferase
MSIASLILALVTLQRLGELLLARRNTRRLLACGAIEVGAGHYPLMIVMHTAWLIALWAYGYDQPVAPLPLIAFVGLQALRWWVIATLGPRWTARIIVLPGQPLVSDGPYRYVSHPNYAVVVGEIALLPLALDLPLIAVVFSVLNATMLTIRIRAESQALATMGGRTA